MAAAPLTVLGAGRTLGADGDWYPTLHVDVTDRPDVADLARVHAVEGVGDLTTSASVVGGRLLLGVALTSPVTCRFSLDLGPEHAELLVDAAVSGHLLLATTPPEAPERPVWLALDVDRGLLLSAVAALAHPPAD